MAAKLACSVSKPTTGSRKSPGIEELLDKTRLRSPINGVVATPHVENMLGRRLQYGDSFAEVVDTSRAIVDVAIDDTDAALLRAGTHASIKLNSFPTRIFRGDVMVVSPKGTLVGDSRVFFARVAIANADGTIRAGMEGRGKVRMGWYPAGYVLFRRPSFVAVFTSLVVVWSVSGLECEWLECWLECVRCNEENRTISP